MQISNYSRRNHYFGFYMISFFSKSSLILVFTWPSSVLKSTWSWPSRSRSFCWNFSGISPFSFRIWPSYGRSSRADFIPWATILAISSALAVTTGAGIKCWSGTSMIGPSLTWKLHRTTLILASAIAISNIVLYVAPLCPIIWTKRKNQSMLKSIMLRLQS